MANGAEVIIEFLPAEQGGRRTPVWLAGEATNYRPHLRVCGGNGEYLGVEIFGGPDGPVVPGLSTSASVRFLYESSVCYDALVVGAPFEVMEGGRVVATGQVTRR
jgi:hypothetical protein